MEFYEKYKRSILFLSIGLGILSLGTIGYFCFRKNEKHSEKNVDIKVNKHYSKKPSTESSLHVFKDEKCVRRNKNIADKEPDHILKAEKKGTSSNISINQPKRKKENHTEEPKRNAKHVSPIKRQTGEFNRNINGKTKNEFCENQKKTIKTPTYITEENSYIENSNQNEQKQIPIRKFIKNQINDRLSRGAQNQKLTQNEQPKKDTQNKRIDIKRQIATQEHKNNQRKYSHENQKKTQELQNSRGQENQEQRLGLKETIVLSKQEKLDQEKQSKINRQNLQKIQRQSLQKKLMESLKLKFQQKRRSQKQITEEKQLKQQEKQESTEQMYETKIEQKINNLPIQQEKKQDCLKIVTQKRKNEFKNKLEQAKYDASQKPVHTLVKNVVREQDQEMMKEHQIQQEMETEQKEFQRKLDALKNQKKKYDELEKHKAEIDQKEFQRRIEELERQEKKDKAREKQEEKRNQKEFQRR
ncbi:hypothetical protein CWI37_0167p0010, partial [Hamiltosporidium tvaerminnensis]